MTVYRADRYASRGNLVNGGHGFMPSAALAQSASRSAGNMSNNSVLTSGKQSFQLIYLPAKALTSITVISGTQALVGGSNQWFSIYDINRHLLAITADDTSTAWGAGTAKTLAITGGYTPPYDALYYIGVMVNAGTVPQLIGPTLTTGALTSIAPALCGYDNTNTGLTNPASAPAAAAAFTATTSTFYCYVS